MRARFLLGPAGSGKTHRCLAEIRERLLADPLGPPLILLAPRQATYQLELELLSQAQPSSPARQAEASPQLELGLQFPSHLAGYARLQIVSFERFALWLLTQLNQRPVNLLSEEGRIMVLRALVHRHHERLRVFRDSSRAAGFARLLSDQLRELQQHQISPAALRAAAERAGQTRSLADKLHDLALLLEAYQDWLTTQKLPDAGTLLDRATAALEAAARGKTPLLIAGLWLDGMAELTPQELELLAALPPFCEQATFAFCLESEPRETTPWLSTWSIISQTFRRCYARFSAIEHCEAQVEVLPRDQRKTRFTPPNGKPDPDGAIRQLEANWTSGKPAETSTAPTQTVRLVACAEPEQEAVMAAREILRFVQAGHRYRDCAVLLRQMDTHYAGLRRIFTRYQIPFFLDRRESVAHHPLAEFTRSALHTVLFHWRLPDWFAALKTGLTPLHADEIDRLENIALAKGWEGNKWLRPLELAGDAALERECEGFRRRVIAPFERLREVVSNEPSGRELAICIRRFWTDFAVGEKLEEWATTAADETVHLTVFEELTDWLDNLERAFADFRLPLREWLPILEAGLGALTVGVIPPAIDQVLIGAVDRSRNPDLKLALVLGLNEGVFPHPPAFQSLLTETDRETLEDLSLNVRNDAKARLGHERYLGYIAFTRARERLVLSWSGTDAAGKVLNVSPLVDHVQCLFPGLAVDTFAATTHLNDCLHASELLAGWVNTGGTDSTPESLPVPALRERIDYLKRCAASYREAHLSPDAVATLFGRRLRTSASRLEQFAACPFQFFVNAGLRARERDRFEVDARKAGTFQHEVLEQFHRELTNEGRRWRDISPEEARQRIARIAAELRNSVAEGVLASHPRHVFRTDSITEVLQEFVATVIAWMKSYQFDPIAVELSIGGDTADLPWWEIDLGDGRQLVFRGSVDRVDCIAVPGHPEQVALTVMDYKSGYKQFEPLKMQAGLQLQLPAYLAALCDVASGSELLQGRKAIPAGMFYVRLRDGSPRVKRRDAEPDTRAAKRFPHTGRFSFEFLTSFDREGTAQQFNYRLTADGQIHGNTRQLVEQEELETLINDARAMLRTMGNRILEGHIAIDPFRKGSDLPCDWCEFKPVCRIDPWTHAYRPLRPILNSTNEPADDQ